MQLSPRFNHNSKEHKHPGHRDGFKPQRRKRGFNLVVFCVAFVLLAARG